MSIDRGYGIATSSVIADSYDLDALITDTQAAKVAAEAAQVAAETAQTAAELAETNAETAETNAETAETNAETAETNAETAETNAETAETNASASATAAASSATSAASSASSAATVNTNVNTKYDNFDDRFLGTKSSDPTLDNDSDALLEGAMYYNSTDNDIRFYNGSSWDAPATDAATAQTAAELAETNAETAETNAETAETNAETAQTAAETAQTAAETAETNAETAQTAAETAETNAEDWASKTTGTVDGTNYSAKYWATQADVGTVATNISNVNTVAGISSDVTAVSGNATNITAVAGNATNINAVNTNSTNINTVATNNTNINTVATDITNVNLAATNIADIEAVADEVQKVIDVADDLNEATSEIDTVATNITNVNAVGNDITNVNTVATNLTSVNAFGETYKIAATAPSSPSDGDLWFDTTADTMKVYNGTSWQNAGSSVNGVENSVEHTATAGQTSFTATYDPGYLQVYLNGVRLDAADYTATNGTTVVLDSGAALNDIVFIQSFGTFTLADHYDKTASDARYLQPTGDGSNLTGINTDLVSDTSPQLGGNLDVQSYTVDGVDIATRDGVLTSTTTTANAALPKAGGAMTGAITTNSTFDGRDVATDGTKLDTVETNADVTDTTNVTSAGALMDSECSSLASVKAINQGLTSTSSPTFTTLNATTVDLGNWTVTESGGVLYFATSGTNKMKVDASGNLTVVGNVTAYGSV